MNFLNIIFIAISKIYLKFSSNSEDWFYLPILIISFITGLNLFIFSMLFAKISYLYPIIFTIILYFLLILYFGKFKKKKSVIKNYELTSLNYFFIILFIVFDVVLLIYSLNTSRIV